MLADEFDMKPGLTIRACDRFTVVSLRRAQQIQQLTGGVER